LEILLSGRMSRNTKEVVSSTTQGAPNGKGDRLGNSKGRGDGGVASMMSRLNLVAREDEKVVMSDDEEDEDELQVFSVIGKVLSPIILNLETIMKAMRPAWGNPRGIRPRSVGENMFIVDFMTLVDKDRDLDGTPWLVGRHAVLL
jgi:hypothetical protein